MSEPIGSRWRSRDKRDQGKVVEVVATVGLFGNRVRVVEAPGFPKLIGRETTILDKTLHACYSLVPWEPAPRRAADVGALSGRAASEPVAWRVTERWLDGTIHYHLFHAQPTPWEGCIDIRPLGIIGAPEGQASGCDPDRCEWWRRFNSGYYAEPVAPADGREGER